MNAPRHWILIGNPENRRVTGFVDAVAREDAGTVTVVPWTEVVARPDFWTELDPSPAFVRIESLGENPEVQNAMLRLGGMPARRPLPFGAFVPPAPSHQGFLALLDRVAAGLRERPQWTPLATPEAIRLVFDKSTFHRHCRDLGVAVAETIEASSRSELEAVMQAEGWGAAFVKIRTGSSAVGVGIYALRPRPTFTTTVHMSAAGWFNSLRLRRYTQEADLDRIVHGLMSHGVHIERAIEKARLHGANFDCRVLMIHGEPKFVVVRQNRHPITNLHLGGWRGDLQALREQCPPLVWDHAMDDARRIAKAYGGLHLGLDILFTSGFQRHVVIEANAFGDLLPRLTHEGRDVYATEVAAAPAWWSQQLA
ncbi:MAG: STM4014 family protein [Myxococcota bacterium]